MDTRLKFSKTVVLSLPSPPPGERATYHDTQTPGLQLRVTSTGVKTFSYVYRVHGRQQRITLGRLPHFTVENARDKVRLLISGIARGENPAEAEKLARKAAAAELTLRQAFDRYYEDYLVPKGKRTAEAIRDDFARYLGYVTPGQKKLHGREKEKAPGSVNWERRKLSSITPADVHQMMNSLADGVGPRTANKVLVLLRAIFNRCIKLGIWVGDNPCAGIEKYESGENPRKRYLTSDELPRFFSALDTMDEDFRDFVLLSLTTGARRKNVMGMRWRDLDMNLGIWEIEKAQSKSGEPLTVPLTLSAMEILTRRREAAEEKAVYVFPAKSAAGHISPPKKKWKALLEAAGIADLRIHDLRRSLGSWQINTGASLAVVGKSLGHRSTEATKIYARLQVDPVRSAMNRAVKAMFRKRVSTTAAKVVHIKANEK